MKHVLSSRRLFTRRRLGLGSLGMGLAAFVAGAGQSARRRFLFVHAEGGWDPLCVFAPLFDASLIDMEPDTAPLSVGDFSLVDSPARPAVPAFFERWGARTLLLNGLSTRSVNHETCQAVALTGGTSDAGTDWATLIAAAEQDDYFLPHLVLNGPSFPGKHSIAVSHAQGLVQEAVHGTVVELADVPLAAPSPASRTAVDDYLAARAAELAATHGDLTLASQYRQSVDRSRALTEARDLIAFPYAETLVDRTANAIRLLADGVARCASVSTNFVWDTHVDNAEQSPLFESLFTDLDAILTMLGSVNDRDGQPLADDTIVVVLSEMGRTPAYNSTVGRDHWPYTSAMLIGAGVAGGRAIGGYTDLYAGIGVDPASGELDADRPGIDANAFGATVLALADLDPGDYIGSPEVITAALA